MTDITTSPISRRRFIHGMGATVTIGGLGGTAGVVSAQEIETIRIGAAFAGYIGMQPAAIQGEKNPALNLEPGTKYEIVLERIDPYNHNVVFIDEQTSTVIERMPQYTSDETPKVRRMEIKATEAMSRYYCDVHPTMMNGPVNLDGGFAFRDVSTETTPAASDATVTSTSTPEPTATATATATPEDTTATTQETQETSSQAPGFGLLSAITGLTAAAGGWRYLSTRGDE